MAPGQSFCDTRIRNPAVVNYSLSKKNIPIIPGCMDTNAIEMALETRTEYSKILSGRRTSWWRENDEKLCPDHVNLHFVPTGGINRIYA